MRIKIIIVSYKISPPAESWHRLSQKYPLCQIFMHKIWTWCCSQISPLIYNNNGAISYSRSQYLFRFSCHTCYACGFPLSLRWLHQNEIIPTHITSHASTNFVHVLYLVCCCSQLWRLRYKQIIRRYRWAYTDRPAAAGWWRRQRLAESEGWRYESAKLQSGNFIIMQVFYKISYTWNTNFFKTLNLKFLMFVYFWVVGLYFKRDNSHCWDLRTWQWS